MRRPDFERCVVAIAETFQPPRPVAANTLARNQAADFLIEVQAAMPDHLRRPFRLLTVIFDASSWVREGKPFHVLDHAARQRRVDVWSRSRIGPCRSLVAFYRTLSAFGGEEEAGVEGGLVQPARSRSVSP